MSKLERTMDYNVQISLALAFENVDAEKIVEGFGLQGHVRAKNNLSRKTGGPLVSTGVISIYSDAARWESRLSEHWDDFQRKILPIKDALVELSGLADRKFLYIIVDYVGRFPCIEITRDFKALLCDLDIGLYFDVYDDAYNE